MLLQVLVHKLRSREASVWTSVRRIKLQPMRVASGGVFGTHILQCTTGVAMFDSSVLQWWGIAEIPTGGTTTNTVGFQVDADADGDAGGTIIGGSINNYETCVKITSHPRGIRILASLTPHASAGAAVNIDAAARPFTEILTPVNYVPTGGISGNSIGSLLPDLTMPQESAPPNPASGDRRVYNDSASTHVSAKKSDGTVVDLEAGLLNYQKAAGAITGNGGDQNVYTFSVPSIPSGKGIRAKVWWTCSTCTGANKVFKWQFGGTGGVGGTVTAYAAVTPSSSNLAYSVVTIFNDPGSQTAQTMFLDTLLIGATNATFGLTSNPAQTTSGAVSLAFLFNAANTEAITPKGFVVEAIE